MRLNTSKEAPMRGDDRQQSSMFSYVAPEARVPKDHPLRAIRSMTDQGLARVVTAVREDLLRGRPSLDPARTAAACAFVAGSVHGAERASSDGGAELQPAVPVVRGLEHGRAGLGRHGVQQEPRTASRWRHRPGLL